MADENLPGDGNLDESVEQLQPEDTLIDEGIEDVLDRGYSPPDNPPLGYGRDVWSTHETLEDRIRQEVPDPDSAYGAPRNESGLDTERLGGDDEDAIDADDDWVGDAEVGTRRAGRLVAPDEGLGDDVDDQVWGEDVGIDGAAASAEEAAVHVIEDESDL